LFKGFCLHPLASPSIHSSSWWLKSPIENIRNKFTELDRSRQTVVLVTLILLFIITMILLISIVLYNFTSVRCPSISFSKHNNREYVMLENLDPDSISNEHMSNETTVPLMQVEQM
jgi:hypothetical protein